MKLNDLNVEIKIEIMLYHLVPCTNVSQCVTNEVIKANASSSFRHHRLGLPRSLAIKITNLNKNKQHVTSSCYCQCHKCARSTGSMIAGLESFRFCMR